MGGGGQCYWLDWACGQTSPIGAGGDILRSSVRGRSELLYVAESEKLPVQKMHFSQTQLSLTSNRGRSTPGTSTLYTKVLSARAAPHDAVRGLDTSAAHRGAIGY